MKRNQISSIAIVLMLLIGSIIIFKNSTSTTAITIKINDGVEEKFDRKIPFSKNGINHLPDYKVEYFYQKKWHDGGTIKNQSAKDGLKFKLPKQPAYELIERVKIKEADVGLDKELENIVIDSPKLNGPMFSYQLHNEFNIGSGVDWFFSTIVGKAILLGLTIAIIIIVLGALG